jgi:class 3 adenylate cyclase
MPVTTTPDGSQNLKLRPTRTFICSVVFIDIVEYTKKLVNEQIRIKERFNAFLSKAIKDISVSDRIILDIGDGAAIGFLGDPEDALFVAMSLRDSLKDNQDEATPDLQVRMGINLGPVKLLKDINNQPNLIGDGINVSQRIMSFAEPGQLLVSRSYYDIVSCLSQEYAKLFQYQGARADKHVREHDIYAVEHTGLNPIPAVHAPEKKPETHFTEVAAVAVPAKPPMEESAGAGPEQATEPTKPGKNKMGFVIGGAVVAAAILALVLFIPKGKAPTTDGTKAAMEGKAAATSLSARASKAEAPAAAVTETTPPPGTASKRTAETKREAFKAVSSRAEDILFTITAMKASGKEVTFTVRTQNKSGVEKSVALYDDTFEWKKSKMTDGDGKNHDVNQVNFAKGSKKIAMSAAGTKGVDIAPGESVTAYLVFKKAGRSVKTLNLHPFIYQGRWSWKEYDLAMPLRP